MGFNKNNYLYQEDIKNALSIKGVTQLRGKSFLITGATGLLGLHLIDVLMSLGDINIFAVGRSIENARHCLGEYFDSPNFSFIEQDVCIPFDTNLKVDYIIPLASNTHPLAYSRYPIETIMINIKGAENAFELAVKCNAMVLYPSSVEIYGNAINNEVFTEDYTGKLNLLTSRACYTESKRLCEAMCQSYISQKGLNVKIVRLSRLFGPTMKKSDSKASSQFILNAVNNENIVLKSEGNQYYSYTYVSDAVAAILYILIHGEIGFPYNISNESCNILLKDFARICAEYNDMDVIYDIPSDIEKRGYSIASQAILNNKCLRELGFCPHYSIKDAIRRTIDILKND